jgi:Flp pilus assembly protein TadD
MTREAPPRTRRDVRPAALSTALLLLLSAAIVAAPETPEVTFTRDVAPLMYDACASCHREGGPAPFSLITYDQVRRRATQIANVTRSRFMPPWKAEPESGDFVGQRRLSAREIQRIQQWVEEGTPEGDPRDLPRRPTWPDGWLLGTPDLVVTLDAPYRLTATGTDVFRIFAIPLPVAAARFVRGIEFHPGNARVVHHANIRVDSTPASRRLDAADPSPGYDGLMPRSAVYPEGHFLGWTPGQVAPLVPSDLAWRLEPGTDLVVQLHMQPSGASEEVKPSIGLFFGRDPPRHTPTILRLGSQGIDIPAGEPRYVIKDAYTLPVDVDVLAVQPHAHYRAGEIKGIATLPGGSTRWMMHITDWDFRWQHVYREVAPIALPKGTVLSMEYTFDNSAENVRNPQVPPVRVSWGQRSQDEMGDLWFQLLARTDRDRATLARDVNRKMTAEDVIGYETMLRASPGDAELHDDVALLYLGLGRPADAVRHFAASAAIQPQSAAAQYNLGTALAAASRLDEAAVALRQALTIDPGSGATYANLGAVVLQQGRVADGVKYLEEAIRLDPGNLQALNTLSSAYAASGRFDRAVAIADAALRLAPPGPLADEIRSRRESYLRNLKPRPRAADEP